MSELSSIFFGLLEVLEFLWTLLSWIYKVVFRWWARLWIGWVRSFLPGHPGWAQFLGIVFSLLCHPFFLSLGLYLYIFRG